MVSTVSLRRSHYLPPASSLSMEQSDPLDNSMVPTISVSIGGAGANNAGVAANADQNSRFEKSLGLLTTKFVTLLQEADGGILDLKVVRERNLKEKKELISNLREYFRNKCLPLFCVSSGSRCFEREAETANLWHHQRVGRDRAHREAEQELDTVEVSRRRWDCPMAV